MSRTRRLIYLNSDGTQSNPADFEMRIQEMADKGKIEEIIRFFEDKMNTHAIRSAHETLDVYDAYINHNDELEEEFLEFIKNIRRNE